MQQYKEEIGTLNEALTIAAQDITEVAEADEDFFLSDEEGTEGDGDTRTAAESSVGAGSKRSTGSDSVIGQVKVTLFNAHSPSHVNHGRNPIFTILSY